jgi:hypothetical protein
LSESFQAGKRACGNVFVEPAIRFDASTKPDHLTQAIEDHQLAVRVSRDHHVETVGTKIDCGKDVRNGLRCAPRHVS